MSSATPKLSPFQTKLLADVAAGKRKLPPDGYPTAGADASWWRSTTLLCKAGLLERVSNCWVRIPVTPPQLPAGAFEERVLGRAAAHARAEEIRARGRRCSVVQRTGPHFLVRAQAA